MTRFFPALVLVSGLGLAGSVLAQGAEKRLPESHAEAQASFAPLVRKTAPAVVNIFTTKAVQTRRGPTLFDDPFFRRFFGEMPPSGAGPRERAQNSLGSGVIVRPEGVIVTNAHVIEGADQIIVVLADRRQFPAQVIGRDERTDLAILRVTETNGPLPHLEIGDSEALEVGDMVLAIGNPFGVGQTVTSGIVSALARTNVGISDINSFIQTDAAINPGNSGGALIAMDGRVVGINTAIFSRSGGSHGIGFAIPATMVRAVISGFTKGDGRLVRPWLGAFARAVTADDAQALGLGRPVGALVESIHDKSPAALAGLRPGDVILSVNGHEVDGDRALRYRIATISVDETAAVKYWRKGETKEVRIALKAPPEDPARDLTKIAGANPLAGAIIANMSPALADELGVDRFSPGVHVIQIQGRSPAARFGFQPADALREINGRKIRNVQDVKAALDVSADRWAITIERGGQPLSLVVGR
ncbi:MAG: Do family serine endopeptidase [Alphaproteobacteria bacterium]|nr:Do family serine endopeptidase [Alphaproteobacteria bacterium]